MYAGREDVSKLSYITMSIKESLRMYPVGVFVHKLLSKKSVVNGQEFPKGIDAQVYHPVYFTM